MLLIEVPKSVLLQQESTITGAYKIAYSLTIGLLSEYQNLPLVLLTDMSVAEAELFGQKQFPKAPITYLNYAQVPYHLDQLSQVQLAFTSDLNCLNLLRFRNEFRLSFSVVGLIHSLGFPDQFSLLKQVCQSATGRDWLICPTESTQKTVRQFQKQLQVKYPQTRVIHFGIDAPVFTKTQIKDALRKQHSIDSNATVLLHLSRLNPFTKMDIFPLLELMSDLLKKCPDAFLYIVGQNHAPHYVAFLNDYIRQFKLENSVRILTDFDQAQIYEFYRMADVFVSLSDGVGETFGLTLLEAMANGLPVVASQWNGYKSVFKQGVHGFFIPTYGIQTQWLDRLSECSPLAQIGDWMAQSHAVDVLVAQRRLTQLIQDSAMRNKMGQAAKQWVEEGFLTQHMMNRYAHFFNTFLNRPLKKLTQFPKSSIAQYSNLFSHFPSKILTASTVFESTQRGLDVLHGEKLFVGFESHLKRYTHLATVFQRCCRKAQSANSLKKVLHQPSEIILHHLIYLTKRGLLKVK